MTIETQIANLMKAIARDNSRIEAINELIGRVKAMSADDVRDLYRKPKARMIANLQGEIQMIRGTIERCTAAMIEMGVE